MEQSNAQIVLDHYLEKYQMSGNMVNDISIDELEFLTETEPVYNLKGEKISKSYFAPNGKECIRIVYEKEIGIHTYNGVEYPDVWVGLKKSFHYIRWDGTQPRVKYKQPYRFDLNPIFLGDGTETVIGFSSQKQRQVLKVERYSADDYLQAKNPDLYALLYGRYSDKYEYYLKTGKKTTLVDAMNAEIDENINAVFNTIVFGTEITTRALIIMNLQ